jgi:hypothetical protein
MASSPKELLKTLGAIAAILVAVTEIARFVNETRADLTATYLAAPFSMPSRLEGGNSVDSAAVQLYSTANRFYDAYYTKLTLAERGNRPDSMRRPRMPAGYYKTPVADFGRNYRSFGTLHIENDGDKTLVPIQVAHKSEVYYEYKDSKGKLQSGASVSKFSVGELVAGESLDIKIWADFAYGDNSRMTITYPDGSATTSRSEQVDGFLAWIARNKDFLFIIMSALSIPVILSSGAWLYSKIIGIKPSSEESAEAE